MTETVQKGNSDARSDSLLVEDDETIPYRGDLQDRVIPQIYFEDIERLADCQWCSLTSGHPDIYIYKTSLWKICFTICIARTPTSALFAPVHRHLSRCPFRAMSQAENHDATATLYDVRYATSQYLSYF
ncbi:hypothetical protein SISNIDRAFT_471627 [Sistotremastrum niveocremeum HHB9708]|uniref:Uncharacterized protein n=1 Tax=Sistotremastrum niveocremeum HHB9708 TaxID=1314777 RepID=A0A164MF48_9AGAM|nr:hypothetical protein SISNIDRAFT_471627 [Sistotremastrum niveocremeum HHB9708]